MLFPEVQNDVLKWTGHNTMTSSLLSSKKRENLRRWNQRILTVINVFDELQLMD